MESIFEIDEIIFLHFYLISNENVDELVKFYLTIWKHQKKNIQKFEEENEELNKIIC